MRRDLRPRGEKSGWRYLVDVVALVAIAIAALLQTIATSVSGQRSDLLGWSNAPVDRVLSMAAGGFAFTGAVFGAVLTAALRRRADGASKAEAVATHATAALFTEVRSELKALTDSLLLFSSGRVNLFLYRDDGFCLVGRYSMMATFDSCEGPPLHPLKGGTLGVAWAEGAAEDLDFPDPARAPKGWRQRQLAAGLDSDRVDNMTMKSRSYAAVRLGGRRRNGVLLAESQSPAPDGVTIAALIAQVNHQQRLVRLLEYLEGIDTPTLRAGLQRALADRNA